MADLRDFTGKNRKFTGVIGEKISPGSTAERDTSFGGGTIRFNTTTTLLEYYDGVQWKSIDAPPTISSISPSTFASDGSTIFTITVTGSNFSIGCTGKFIGNDGTIYTPGTVTRVSASSVTMTTLTSMTVANEPYDVQIINSSGLSATLEDALDAGSTPAFTVAAGSLGTLANGNRAATALTSQTFGPATDADGQQINYTITSGSISPGLSLGTPNDGNNGKIVGTATAVESDTTSTFTIQASDGVNTASRQFTITVSAPIVTSYTSVAGFTFAVPAGVTSVGALVIGGGGGGGSVIGGGGGAGGMVETNSYPVTPGGNVSGNVGGGGAGQPPNRQSNGQSGQNSTFGNITAYGGGGGNSWSTPGSGSPGGSGGGGSNAGPSGGSATQTNFAPVSATGYGNPGYKDGPAGNWAGAGGGAGEGGPTGTHRRIGGDGRASNMSGSPVTYAGGGGGAGHGQGSGSAGGSGGGGAANTGSGQAGTANRGSGGGGGYHPPDVPGGSGGSGIVIIKY